ncbi:MAG TPA: polysaccharide biosynthesis tyrosine autokinase [Acidisarcina sp.]
MRSLDKDPTLRDLVRVFGRRKKVFFEILGGTVALAILLCIFSTRRYQASGMIQLQKASSDGLGLDSMISGASGGASDALSLNIDIQTQSSILQSDPLALKVIEQVKLESNNDFKPHFHLLGWLAGLMSPAGANDEPGASLENSPRRSERLLAVFDKNLKVRAVAGTRLIEVEYSNPDPKVAAAVVNSLIEQLIEFTFQVRFTATNQVSKWLEGELKDLRETSENLQARVVAMQKTTGLYGMGGVDLQGRPVVYSPVLDRLQQATAGRTQAEENRILKEAITRIAGSGDADLISQLSGPMVASSQGVASSLSLIQSLRGQEATALAEEKEDSLKYGPKFPKFIQEEAALARIRKSIDEETARVASRANNDFEIAVRQEAGARAAFEQSRSEAERLNDKTIDSTILQKEADESEQLYQSLLAKLKQAGIIEGLHSSNVTVVSRARRPSKPDVPNVKLYLLGGIGLGLIFGLGGAMIVDSVDGHIQSAEEIDDMNLPLLGFLPKLEGEEAKAFLPMLASSHSPYAEAMRRLRSTLLLSRSGLPPRVLLVASARPGEGKSTLAVNLAVAFAQTGQKVLLVETDMRRPVLQRRLGLESSVGLSRLLSGVDAIARPVTMPQVPGLSFIEGGPVPPYPADLLGSPRFGQLIKTWLKDFELIVLDSPPLLPVADVQSIARYANSTLLVARSGFTTRTSLQRTFQILLPHLSSPSMGVVLNAVSTRSQAYHEYYGYRQTRYATEGERL